MHRLEDAASAGVRVGGQDHGARTVAEDDRDAPLGVVHHARQHLDPDHGDVARAPGADHGVRQVQAVEKAAARRRDVEGRCVLGADRLADARRSGGAEHLAAHGGDDDHVQFVQYIEKYKNIPFMIFLSKPTANNKLTEMFAKKLAVKPWDGYPHFILLDAENVIVGQGNYDAEQLADFILTEE